MLFKIYLRIFPLFFICVFSSCLNSNIKRETELRFAVITNTHADSPYAELSPKLQLAIDSINRDNPVFLVHLGGIVCGGSEWMGITESDIKRQYKKAFEQFSGLSPILYSVIGESDLLNTSSGFYEKYTKHGTYYSFNYGDLHFIVLDSTETDGFISPSQKNWLIEDLKKYRDSSSVFIFINSVLYFPEQYGSFKKYRCKDYKMLHKHFTESKVKAVFSGNLPFYFIYDYEGISYINTGSCGFNKSNFSKDCIQYYIINLERDNLKVSSRYIGLHDKIRNR